MDFRFWAEPLGPCSCHYHHSASWHPSMHACMPKLQVCLVPVLKPVINYKVFSFKVCVNWTWLGPAWEFFWSIENWETWNVKNQIQTRGSIKFSKNPWTENQRLFQMEQTCWNWDKRLRFYWKLKTRQVWFKLVLCGSLFFFREPSVKVNVHFSNSGGSLVVRFMFFDLGLVQ
jgi:hypothetical protein